MTRDKAHPRVRATGGAASPAAAVRGLQYADAGQKGPQMSKTDVAEGRTNGENRPRRAETDPAFQVQQALARVGLLETAVREGFARERAERATAEAATQAEFRRISVELQRIESEARSERKAGFEMVRLRFELMDQRFDRQEKRLRNAIAQEGADRRHGDGELKDLIVAEGEARREADGELKRLILAEGEDRRQADAELKEAITIVVAGLQAAREDLGFVKGRLKALYWMGAIVATVVIGSALTRFLGFSAVP